MPKKVENVDKPNEHRSTLQTQHWRGFQHCWQFAAGSVCPCVPVCVPAMRERERGLTTMLKASTGAGFKRLRPPQQSDRFAVYRVDA